MDETETEFSLGHCFFSIHPGMTGTVVVMVADLMVGEAWDLAAEVVETTGDTITPALIDKVWEVGLMIMMTADIAEEGRIGRDILLLLVVVEVEEEKEDGEVREEVATAIRMHRHTTITKVGGEKCGLWHCCLQIQSFVGFIYLVYVRKLSYISIFLILLCLGCFLITLLTRVCETN